MCRLWTRPSFDSILVRLKEVARQKDALRDECFDSILVRLKVYLKTFSVRVPILFRFHTGSIKSLPTIRKYHHFLCFDSILVRLKADTALTKKEDYARFDSILVRLKEKSPSLSRRLTISFRFHTGSIKRQALILPEVLLARVSIPYWFD